MTEKRYTYSELNNCQYSVSYTTFEEIYGEENVFHSRICEVNNKKQAQKVVDLLNEQEEEIRRLNHLVKIATNLIEWNTIPQIRREWQKHLSKVGDD